MERDAQTHEMPGPLLTERGANDILRHATCAVCLGIKNVPMAIECGHSFCAKCISQWKETATEAGRAFTCPTCRVATTQRPTPQVDTAAIIDALFDSHLPVDSPLARARAEERTEWERSLRQSSSQRRARYLEEDKNDQRQAELALAWGIMQMEALVHYTADAKTCTHHITQLRRKHGTLKYVADRLTPQQTQEKFDLAVLPRAARLPPLSKPRNFADVVNGEAE